MHVMLVGFIRKVSNVLATCKRRQAFCCSINLKIWNRTRLEAFHHTSLRRLLDITRVDTVKNESKAVAERPRCRVCQ